jgi:acyl-CoA synthetase (AMP-forming)/AMP-acid ligase II
LCIAGASVMEGYWNVPENTATAFLPGRDIRWYRTGDIVAEFPDGNYKFLGRRDRMIKKRGFRIELGEIEVALYRYPAIKEAAVLAFPDIDGVPVKAFTSTHDGSKLPVIIARGLRI